MLNSRSLPWTILAATGGLLASLWATGILGGPTTSPSGTDASRNHLKEKHYVTPQQLAASNGMIRRVVEDLSDLPLDGRPLVLVFLKDGCPCNVEFEPFFQRVEKAYRDVVRFVGVIDAPHAAARHYATDQRVPYPVLPDPERRIIRRLKAENGGYVVLLTPDGVIDGYWPGCTADTMRELGQRIARLAGVPERPIDVSDMPGSLTTGCPYEP